MYQILVLVKPGSGCKNITFQYGKININPNTRCFIYHNLELALQAFESNREIMYDPNKADFFVRINGNGLIYNEKGGPGDQFFFDFRNQNASDWYINTVLNLIDNPFVDGIFTDDLEGFPSEHDYAPINTNTSYDAIAALQFASLENSHQEMPHSS